MFEETFIISIQSSQGRPVDLHTQNHQIKVAVIVVIAPIEGGIPYALEGGCTRGVYLLAVNAENPFSETAGFVQIEP